MDECNFYILNLYANKIEDFLEKENDYKVDTEFLRRYRSIHNSMMLEHLVEIDKNFVYKRIENNIYSLSLINVQFDDNKKKWSENEHKYTGSYKGVRTELYRKGFTVNGIKYVEFQRSSSKSRNGNNLFIREDLLGPMKKWTRIELDIENVKCDVGAFRAYESLTSSDINGKIKILPKNILIVDDVKGFCKAPQSITTRDENGVFHVNEYDDVEVRNDIFDGESLLDETKFTGNYKGKGFILLRNHFFKTACFNTKMQQYFSDYGIETVTDMFGVEHDAKDIMMITTPNSVKLFKFCDLIPDGKSMRDCWEYLMKYLEPKWGICKTDHKSKFTKDFRGTQQMSYQFLNSLPLTKEEVEQIADLEISYSNELKTNFEKFMEYTSLKDSSEHRFVLRMVAINPMFQGTQYFKSYYNDQLKYRKENLQQGKIRIKGSDNMTFLGNPLELLRHACNQPLRTGEIHTGYQVYSKKYKDGQHIAMFRSPHLASGNIVYAENKDLKEFKYLNLTKNIIIINSYDSDIYNRLQGADLDSDFAFVTNNEIIVAKAKECQAWYTPVNGVMAVKKLRKFIPKEKSIVDKKIANNKIGLICNTGQILNSWLWEMEYRGEHGKAKEIYNLISELSSLSQLEIDKAKKLIDINMNKEINVITDKAEKLGIPVVNLDRGRKQIVQPEFFRKKAQIANSRNKDKYKKNKVINPYEYMMLHCPMDMLIEILDEKVKVKSEVRTIPIEEILSIQKMAHKDNESVIRIEELASITQNEMKSLWSLFETSVSDYYAERNRQERIILSELSEMKITEPVIARIIYDIHDKENINRPGKKLLSWLWDAKTEVFENCINGMTEQITDEEMKEKLKVRRRNFSQK